MNIIKLLMNLMKLWLCMTFCPKKRSKVVHRMITEIIPHQITVSAAVLNLP